MIAMIRRYVARTDGRAFVLFTSYEMMQRVAERAGPLAGRAEPGPVLARPTGMPRSQMLERFKANPRVGAVRRPTASGRASTCRATPCRT